MYIPEARLRRAGEGGHLAPILQLVVDNVTISGLTTRGIEVSLTGGIGVVQDLMGSVINVESCLVAFNGGAGINASVAGSTIRLSSNDILNNTSGIVIAAGATVASAGGASAAPNAALTVQ